MRLLHILRDNIWQFISVVVGIIAILAAYQIFFAERNVKALQIVTLASTSLIEVDPRFTEDIEISYQGQPIANLSLVQIKLENTGNQALREEDYSQPIQFTFPEGSLLVDAAVIESNPANLGLTVTEIGQNYATLSSILLNPKDRAVIRFLLVNMPQASQEHPFDVDARIAEISGIELVSAIEQQQSAPREIPAGILVLSGVILTLLIIGAMRLAKKKRRKSLEEAFEELAREQSSEGPHLASHRRG